MPPQRSPHNEPPRIPGCRKGFPEHIRHSRRTLVAGLLLLTACQSSAPATKVFPDPPAPHRGFQIQIYATSETAEARAVAEEASDWFAALDDDMKRMLHGSTNIPVEIKWLQPHYRIRVGRFRTREAARNMWEKMQGDFPAALIVPDTIE